MRIGIATGVVVVGDLIGEGMPEERNAVGETPNLAARLQSLAYAEGKQRIVLELKVLHKTLKQTLQAGLKQTWQYMDRCGTDEGYLIVFDRRPDRNASSMAASLLASTASIAA